MQEEPTLDSNTASDLDLAFGGLSDQGGAFDVAPPVFSPLPYSYAKTNRVIVSQESGGILLSHTDDLSLDTLAELRRRYQATFKIEHLEQDEFNRALSKHYESTNNDASQVMDDLGESLNLSDVANEVSRPDDLLESQDDAPIIRLINAVIAEAIKSGASDIHIEPFEHHLSIRMRVDGVLRQVLSPPKSIAPLVISRIKVMAELDIAEKRIPQDGRISTLLGGRSVDVRVSTLPSGHGERVVMRILDKQASKLNLEDIGMAADVLKRFKRLINMPHGILLVTGPTGSGKTTTLYSAISMLNHTSRNILTVEDPIEYKLEGIGQSQVNTKVNMTFARGLRAILRQDPDIVMVGEIRDLETAQIAVQASLTGHLVLSTLHTNTAVGAVTRLKDMGVESFLLSSSVIGVLAQRLVRLLCDDCKVPHTPNEAECKALGLEMGVQIYQPSPQCCDRCKQSGYVGRCGIYELVEVNESIKRMIHDEASEQDIEAEARRHTPSILADARELVLSGKTSVAEVMRVTQEV